MDDRLEWGWSGEEYDDGFVWWVLYALRETLSRPEIRKIILESHFLPEQAVIGPTFDETYSVESIEDYLQAVDDSPEFIHLWTATNKSDGRLQSHFQTFIVKDHVLYVFDPAHTETHPYDPGNPTYGWGIWSPYIADQLIIPFFHSRGYQVWYYSYTSGACQRQDDVFCQSWSLLMQLDFIRDLDRQALTLHDLYRELINFFVQVLQIPEVYDQFISDYRLIISTNPRVVKYSQNQKKQEEIRRTFIQIDPHDVILSLLPEDLYDEK